MAPLIRALVLTLMLVQVMHVYFVDCQVTPIAPIYGSVDKGRAYSYTLSFYNKWESNQFNYAKGPMMLKCFAILYYTKNPTVTEITSLELYVGKLKSFSFYIRPRAFPFGWRIECDYRFDMASNKERKQGIVLLSGPNDWKCLSKNGGCQIKFIRGEARRISRFGGDEFIGELPETKCKFWNFYCKERDHPKFMFGVECPFGCFEEE